MTKLNKYIPLIIAAFIPLYPMIYLYNQSKNYEYLSLAQVLLVSLVFILGSTVIFLAVKKMIRSPHAALLICIICWVFFFSNDVRRRLSIEGGFSFSAALLILLFAFIVLSLTVYILFKKFNLELITKFAGIMLAFLIVYNGGLAAFNYLSLGNDSDAEYKTSFTVDDTLLTPNVYWFHCDGMLGFDAMEKYFGDSQNEFTQDLETRGFIINRGAQFEASHSTQVAMPALMNPFFFDSYLSNNIDNRNFAKLLAARQRNELVLAFSEKNYHSAIIGGFGIYTFPISDSFYDMGFGSSLYDSQNQAFKKYSAMKESASSIVVADSLAALLFILRDVTFLSILNNVEFLDVNYLYNAIYLSMMDYEEFSSTIDADPILLSNEITPDIENLVYGLDNVLDIPDPRFALIMYGAAHGPFIYDENGQIHNFNSLDIHNYPPQHVYARKVLLNMVDMILERDTDAVIVLQADHGLHVLSAEQIMEGLSCSDEGVKDIWNGVMSAVRIPPRYGSLNEPLHPLNITRHLVNNYIGENYAYLDQ